MNELHEKIVKDMLNIINSREIYGYEIFSMLKEKYNNLDDVLVYSSFKSLEKNGYITTFKTHEDNSCCVKLRYCLSEKGQEMLNSLT